MTPFTVRGVPNGLQKDAWWMAADATTGIGTSAPKPYERIAPAPIIALLILIVFGDLLLFQIFPGVALPVFLISVAVCAHGFCFRVVPVRSAIVAWGTLLVALIPAVDLVQPISVAFALSGMLAFVGIMVGREGRAATWAAIRFPLFGVIQTFVDANTLIKQPRQKGDALIASLRDWIVPGVLGLVFAGIMIIANPVLDAWITAIFTGRNVPLPQLEQVVFWSVLALLIWPFLRLTGLQGVLIRPTPEIHAFGQVWYLSARSVTRALVLFNLIFAVQTLTDIAILRGNAALPDGLTYAEYAYRGAYPLLAAALLAGGFALLAQPFLAGRPVLRAMLLLWITQTALLVASSMLRLDLYIDTYGLTRLRFLALIWMAVIGGGLVLMLWQTLRGFGPGWLLMRAAELGLVATYVVALINVDGFVARHNLNKAAASAAFERQLQYDGYMCRLGDGAVPAMVAYNQEYGNGTCDRSRHKLAEPADWREWGYRNARLRHKLSEIKGATQ